MAAQGPGIWLFVGEAAPAVAAPKLHVLASPIRWMIAILMRMF